MAQSRATCENTSHLAQLQFLWWVVDRRAFSSSMTLHVTCIRCFSIVTFTTDLSGEVYTRADLGVGPGGPGHPFCGLLNISASHVQCGIQSFAKFKRLECTRLHLRELQPQKYFRRSMHPKLPRKVAPFAVLITTIATIWPLYTLFLGSLYHKIFRPPMV